MEYCIFNVQGGLGKHVAATAVAEAIKKAYPDRQLIVLCTWNELFLNLPFVDRVYKEGITQYFYQNYIEGRESLIFGNEPYFTSDHINKKLPLVQSWLKMYGIPYNGETPTIILNDAQKAAAKSYWGKNGPYMVLHTNGGFIHPVGEGSSYSWARDMPLELANQIVEKYKDKYHIYQVAHPNAPVLPGTELVTVTDHKRLSDMEFFSLLLYSDKRVLIDSSLQHASAAFNIPSVVLWNGTSPKIFGYDIHTNIETTKPYNFKLPDSVFFDFDFAGNNHEYPFPEGTVLYDPETVFESIDELNN